MTATPPDAGHGLGQLAARLLLVGLFIVVFIVLWRLRDIFAIAFGAMVLGVGFRGMADALSRRTRLPAGICLAASIVICLGTVVAAVEVFGAAMAAQYGDLLTKLPQSVGSLSGELRRWPLGDLLLSEGRTALRAGVNDFAPRFIARAIGLGGQGFTYALIMIASGVFLAIDPLRYRKGFLRLVPRPRRARAAEVLEDLSTTLRRWLMGRIVVMVAVGVLSSLGLWALGIDAPFALGLTGAVLTFIPLLGSIAAALPGMLIGFLQAPIKAVEVGLVFWFVHFIEGTFITPYVQDETVDVPPVISVFATVIFGLLFGPVGVILTGPFTVALMVLVERLYIEDVLGEAPASSPKPKAKSLLRRLVGSG